MYITSSNVIKDNTPALITGSIANGVIENILDPNFSVSLRTSGSILEVSIGAATSVNYVTVSGHVAHTVEILDGTTPVTSESLVRNNNLMFVFTEQSFTDLRIRLTSAIGDNVLFLVTCGSAFEAPLGGEQSGYSRAWLGRGLVSKAKTTTLAYPNSILKKKIPLSVTLKLSNMTAEFSQTTWQDFLDFIEWNLFFIVEDETKPESSYVCFDPNYLPPKAHSATRALNNVSLKFKCNNGI